MRIPKPLALIALFLLVGPAVCATSTTVEPSSPTQAQPGETATVTCTFTHPAYSGACKESVTSPRGVAPSKACQAILDCLNAPSCTRTYCQATTIRGGWKLESAKLEAPKKP